jgi:Dipeptidyl aminopeptidases/acylaminoacyl-peptidases
MKTISKFFIALTLFFSCAQTTASAAFLGDLFYDYTLSRYPLEEMIRREGLETQSQKRRYDFYLTQRAEHHQWLSEQKPTNLTIESFDGLKLYGSYLERKKSAPTVIIAHGYRSDSIDMVPFAQYFQSLGFNVLLPDARGHGKSDGDHVGMGWHDRLDYLKWIDQIIEKNGKDSTLILYGASMGGSTVLMAGGEKLPPQVKLIIADCAYTNAYDIIAHQLEKRSLPGISLDMDGLNRTVKAKANYDLKEASALARVKKIKVPIIFIHGEEDDFVPIAMTQELYKAARTTKQLILAPHAGHMTALRDPNVREQVTKAIQEYLKGEFP